MDTDFTREAILQKPVAEGTLRCHVCERRCVIPPGQLGWCRTRLNRGGKLLTLVYGAISTMTANAIEKKPLYHFYPGTKTMTAGGWCCNFPCLWCRNWDLAHADAPLTGEFISPSQFISIAEEAGCQGIAMSFNEPTLALEWVLNAFETAQARGLYNVFVTNGYMTPEALMFLINAGMHAMNVDINTDVALARRFLDGVDMERIWMNCKIALQYGVHVEISTLVIPALNDDEGVLRGIARRIAVELGVEIPWHLAGYVPSYKYNAPHTPLYTLEMAWEIGKGAGLHYVYINQQGNRHENTECPNCGSLLIRRLGPLVLSNVIRNGACPRCGTVIRGVWG
jgi:pyruvate formate lyase activating enzyme